MDETIESLYRSVDKAYKDQREYVEKFLGIAGKFFHEGNYLEAYRQVNRTSYTDVENLMEEGHVVNAQSFKLKVRSAYLDWIKSRLDFQLTEATRFIQKDPTQALNILNEAKRILAEEVFIDEDRKVFVAQQKVIDELVNDIQRNRSQRDLLVNTMGELNIDERIKGLQQVLDNEHMTQLAAQLLAQAYLEKAVYNLLNCLGGLMRKGGLPLTSTAEDPDQSKYPTETPGSPQAKDESTFFPGQLTVNASD